MSGGYPFTPDTTFSDNSVPKVTAGHLNRWQNVDNALAWATYHQRPQAISRSTNSADVIVSVAPMMILDAALNIYTYCAWADATLTPAQLETPAASWPSDKWLYVYAYSDSRIGKMVVSETAPAVIMPAVGVSMPHRLWKTGDETRRLVAEFRTDGAGNVLRFKQQNQRSRYLDKQTALAVTTAGAGWTTYNSVDLSAYVPPQAQMVDLLAALSHKAAGGNIFQLSSDGSGTPLDAVQVSAWEGSGYSQRIKQATIELPLLTTSISARITTATAAIKLDVLGYAV